MITFQRALQLIRNGLYVNSIFNSLKKNKKIGFIYAMYTISKRCRLLFYGKMPFFLRAWKKIKPMIREYFLSLFIRLKLLICVFTDFFSVVFSCLFVFLSCFVRVFFLNRCVSATQADSKPILHYPVKEIVRGRFFSFGMLAGYLKVPMHPP